MSGLEQRLASLTPAQRALLELRLDRARRRSGGSARPGGSSARTVPATAPIPRRPPAEDYPLTVDQERIFLIHELLPESPLYNLYTSVRLRGRPERRQFARAVDEIVRRHEILRTRFVTRRGRPVQVIEAELRAPVLELDLRGLPEEVARRVADREVRRILKTPFDLAQAPLCRFLLVRVRAEESIWARVFHHIVTDWISFHTFEREFALILRAFSLGRQSPLPELPVQWADYAIWERRQMAEETLEAQRAYWREHLRDVPEVTELPIDFPRPAVQQGEGRRHLFSLSRRASDGIRSLARGHGVTLFIACLALFKAFVARSSGVTRVAVGSPMATRRHRDLEELIGFFLHQLLLYTDLGGDPTFHEVLARVRRSALGAFAHKDVPFGQIVELVNPPRDLSRMPLTQLTFLFLNAHQYEVPPLPDLEPLPYETDGESSKYDMTFVLWDEPVFKGMIEYNSELFHPSTIERFVRTFGCLVESVIEDAERPLWSLGLLTPAQRHQVRLEWNDVPALPDHDALVHETVAAFSRERPDAVLLEGAGHWLSAGEVDRRARELAVGLRRHGVRPETPVAVLTGRRPELAVAFLAVLRAGGVYLPLPPEAPLPRLLFMVEDAGATVLLAARRWRELAESLADGVREVVDLETVADPDAEEIIPGPPVLPDQLAYLIYTSGSTGRPKGVGVVHRSLARLAAWHRTRFGVGVGDQASVGAAVEFDASVWELANNLAAGTRLSFLDDEDRTSPARLLDRLAKARITMSFVPTLMAHPTVREAPPPGLALATLLTGGEALQPLQSPPPATLFNLYGPTETTAVATCAPVTPFVTPSIGRPLPAIEAHVVDAALEPSPLGLPGELAIGGENLARGYLGRPGLTAARFVPDPLGERPGARLYRTGDGVRWLPQGELGFLGRLDHQVKIRGVRVEPGELEAALREHPRVRDAVAVALGAGESARLVAYVVADLEGEAGDVDLVSSLRPWLRERLPVAMLPATIVPLESLPQTSRGKVDRSALPAPEEAARPEGEASAAPGTPVAEVVAGIWSDLLGVPVAEGDDFFFDLGGHSLLATQVMSRVREAFGVEVPLRALFESPTVAGLAERIEEALREGSGGAAIPPLVKGERRAGEVELVAPLSYAQQRLWFLDRLEGGSAVYNVPLALELSGPLSVGALRRALEGVVARHEVLRTRFPEEDGEGVQEVVSSSAPAFSTLDLSGPGEASGELERVASAEARRPFDLSRGPVVRALVVRLGAEEHVLVLTMHHIVSDGWSLGVLLEELTALYGAELSGSPSPLPELPVQYGDFALWQRSWLVGEELERQLGYWRERLAGAAPVLELPTDRPRPAVQSYRGAVEGFRWPASLGKSLRELGRRQDVTLFMTLLAALQAVLGRWSGQGEVSVGTPIANRTHRRTEELIGFFVNTLVLRTDLEDGASFVDLLERVREVSLGAYAHQDVPFEQVVDALEPERSLSYAPLFQVMFVVQNQGRSEPELPGLGVRLVELSAGVSRFDLTLSMREESGGLAGGVEYAADLFDRVTVRRLVGQWRRFLERAVASPEAGIESLDPLSASERQQVLCEWGESAAVPAGGTLGEWVASGARGREDAVAVVCGEVRLSYGELLRRSDRLAARLRRLGVGPESRVGLLSGRTADLVVGLVGILRSGGAYVALDPEYPAERLRFMVEDSGMEVLVAAEGLSVPGCALEVVGLEEAARASGGVTPPAALPAPEGLAYVIYTSGSTGRPKGVGIAHASAVTMLGWGREAFGAEELSGVLASTSICFDLSVYEVFLPLGVGGTVVVAETLLELPELGAGARVSLLNTVPSALGELLSQGGLPASVRTVNVAGEPLPGELVERAYRAGGVESVYNLYGPSEGTTYSTWWRVEREPKAAPAIGRSVGGTRVVVLDGRGRPSPPGVVGELSVGGRGVARGYLGRPGLTASRFVPDPWGVGERLYRTGDRVRFRRSGELEFLGRVDHQVKLRGFRIELGEIESVLRAHPGVAEAVVVVGASPVAGRPRLVGYYTAVEREADPAVDPEVVREPGPEALRAHLTARLPAHMVPPVLVRLEALPLTANGKVDRRALPAPEDLEGGTDGPERAHREPRSAAERALASIWSEILGAERVGLDDNFFTLGGDSILSLRVVSRARRAGLALTPKQLFQHQTLGELAAAAGVLAETPAPRETEARPVLLEAERARLEASVPDLEAVYPLAPMQGQLLAETLVSERPGTWMFQAVCELAGDLDPDRFEDAWQRVVDRHSTLRTAFAWEGLAEPVQVVRAPGRVRIPCERLDWSAHDPAEHDDRLAELLARDRARGLDPTRAPLCRLTLVRLAGDVHRLIFTFHHLVLDGWSANAVMFREVLVLYHALGGEDVPQLSEPPPYERYVAWLQGRDRATARDFWRRTLAGASLPTPLPEDPPVRGDEEGGGGVVRTLSESTSRRLEAVARRHRLTLSTLAQGAWALLLSHHCGGIREVVFGSVVSGRPAELDGMESLAGCLINTVPFRVAIEGELGLLPWLAGLQDLQQEVLDLGWPSADRIRCWSGVAPGIKLFETSFVFINHPAVELPGAVHRRLSVRGLGTFEENPYALDAAVVPGRELSLTLLFRRDRYSEETVAGLLERFATLLESMADRPERSVGSLLEPISELPSPGGSARSIPAPAGEPSALSSDHGTTTPSRVEGQSP